mmetsp:Transcript_27242/g.70596  ORF Transcript_27242/g.70596 Transcript_27242/m.70596 type:complete len:231 (-) Transcript_27242:263-955(-)
MASGNGEDRSSVLWACSQASSGVVLRRGALGLAEVPRAGIHNAKGLRTLQGNLVSPQHHSPRFTCGTRDTDHRPTLLVRHVHHAPQCVYAESSRLGQPCLRADPVHAPGFALRPDGHLPDLRTHVHPAQYMLRRVRHIRPVPVDADPGAGGQRAWDRSHVPLRLADCEGLYICGVELKHLSIGEVRQHVTEQLVADAQPVIQVPMQTLRRPSNQTTIDLGRGEKSNLLLA